MVVLGHSTLALSFVLWFGGAFFLLRFCHSKDSLLLFKFMLNLSNILTHCAKRRYVQEMIFFLDIFVQITTILEYQMSLIILDTQLCA